MSDGFTPVARGDIEQLWSATEQQTTDPRAGIFGPDSVSWRVNRESALFLGAGRASLLQLAHPWVATALEQHSNLRSDPLARFHNTFRVVFTMIFGTLEQALSASRKLYDLHTHITGELPASVGRYPQGSHYQANEMGALLWVFATLIESAVMAHDAVLPPLTDAEREDYYRESRTMAALFGIPGGAMPADWQAFTLYTSGMLATDTLGVDARARDLAHGVLHGRGSHVPVPSWYRALTAAWLPLRLRSAFALPYSYEEQRAAERAQHWLPRVYPHLPGVIRFVGPYREAQARLAGHSVSPVTRWSNRFWMGQEHLMPAEEKRRAPAEPETTESS